MAFIFGDGGFEYLDHDALVGGGIDNLSTLRDTLDKNPESGWTFVEQYLTTHLSRQLEYRINHPEDDINSPLYTADFYKKYNEYLGRRERYTTTDQLQLTNRIINHPKYKQTSRSLDPIQLTFVGCGTGKDNVDGNIINNVLGIYPSFFHLQTRRTTLVAIEPYPPPAGRNPYLKPFYEQDLTIVAQNPREMEASDGAFLLGSPRMDMLYFLDRLKSMIALNGILKPGGFVAIDEACPATSMPGETGQHAYEDQESYNRAFHPWMAEGYFQRKWKGKDGEFGKYFYAEPFELYYTLMRQAGFKLSLGSYHDITNLLRDPRLSTEKTEWGRVLARHLPPKDLFEHVFYQSFDEQRVYNRYVLFWEKEAHPNPEFTRLISDFETYETSLTHRLKQQSVN